MKAHEVRRRGFTLIELLVVIAIIAILAAILFPVFARARENARKATCQSSLKQIGSAMMMYYQDYDENYPAYRYGPGCRGKYNPLYCWWPELVDPYMKNLDVIHCPSAPRKRVAGSGTTTEFWYGLGYNYLLSPTESHGRTFEIPAARERPAETIMAVDATVYIIWCPVVSPNYWHDGSAGGTAAILPLAQYPWARYQGVADWHMEGGNILWCDGHVKWEKINKIVDRRNERKWWGH